MTHRLWILSGCLLLAVSLAIAFETTAHGVRPHPPSPPCVSTGDLDRELAGQFVARIQAIRQSPSDSGCWGAYGISLLAHGFSKEAMACFQIAEQRDPTDSRWPYYQGQILYPCDLQASAACFERAARRSAPGSAARHRHAEVLVDLRDWTTADRAFIDLLRDDPGDPRALLGRARIAAVRGQRATCITSLYLALRREPWLKSAHLLMAEELMQIDDSVRAEKHRKIASGLAGDRSWSDPYLLEVSRQRSAAQSIAQRVEALRREGNLHDALTLAEEFSLAEADGAREQLAWGRLCHALGRHDDYATAVRRALAIQPRFIEALLEMAQWKRGLGDTHGAVECYERVLEEAPLYAEANFRLAQCYEILGDFARAMQRFQLAIRVRPEMVDAHRALGKLLREQGRESEGIRSLRNALAINPADAMARELLLK